MRAFRMMCAAIAALLIGVGGLPGIAAADPATPQQLYDSQVAYDDSKQKWEDAKTALDAGIKYYETDQTHINDCYRIHITNGNPPSSSDYLQCYYDRDDYWRYVEKPDLEQDVDDTYAQYLIDKGWYDHYRTCGNSC